MSETLNRANGTLIPKQVRKRQMCKKVSKAAIAVLLAISCLGCGSNSQQRYATALSILESEERRLKELEPEFDAACEPAYRILCKKSVVFYAEAQETVAKYPEETRKSYENEFLGETYRKTLDRGLAHAKENLELAQKLIAKAKSELLSRVVF
jgi:hypothetical protein